MLLLSLRMVVLLLQLLLLALLLLLHALVLHLVLVPLLLHASTPSSLRRFLRCLQLRSLPQPAAFENRLRSLLLGSRGCFRGG